MGATPLVENRKVQRTHLDPSRTESEIAPALDTAGRIPFAGRGLTPSTQLTAQQVLYLQRTAGNRATAQFLHNQRPSSPTPPPDVQRIAPGAQPGWIQRKKKGFYDKAKGIKPSTQNVSPGKVGGDFYRLSLGVMISDKDFLAKSTNFVIYKFFNSLKPAPFRKTRQQLKAKAPTDTGHAWVELTHYTNGAMQNFHSFGFMPRGGGTGEVVSPDPNSMKDPPAGSYTQDFNLTIKQYSDALARAQQLQTTAKKYNLYGFNCTAFAKEIVNAAGYSFAGTRVSPGAKVGPGSAFTPNRLHAALKAKAKKGKSLSHSQVTGRVKGELDARRALANQSPITLVKPLDLYDSSDTFQTTWEAGEKMNKIERPSSDPGWREVYPETTSYWVKPDELEKALGHKVGDGEYTSMQQILVAEQALTSATTQNDESTSLGSNDVTGGVGELTGQTPEELLENVDPQALELEQV